MAGRSSQGGGVDPDALLKKADKLSVVSLTQWKPDYEQAAGLFEQAGEPAARPTRVAVPGRRRTRRAGTHSWAVSAPLCSPLLSTCPVCLCCTHSYCVQERRPQG